MEVTIIGGGLAGVEAAYQLARRGYGVTLFEMRPHRSTPAHTTPYLSELVCSNSLKSNEISNAHGLIKEELRRLGSLLIRVADETSIPGGKALVVDRKTFSQRITKSIKNNPFIRLIREEALDIPSGVVIIATGPLTSDAFSKKIKEITGEENLFFYDAISPIIDSTSIDMSKAFYGARYMERKEDYINCPLTEDEYNIFYDELIRARQVSVREFDTIPYFEGCLPIEVLAGRGKETLLYGPMKPVGLKDIQSQKRPYAVLQLRREDEIGSMYNMVGFQTRLTYTEQERVFRLIPALRKAIFFRYGSVHRNTYINSPLLLNNGLQLLRDIRIFFAGQITGVEGYVESMAMGLIAGISVDKYLQKKPFIPPPEHTCVGALLRYITTVRHNFQPMNINFGLIKNYSKKEKASVVTHALESIAKWKKMIDDSNINRQPNPF
jgi:methylenetetrahydrofolate--tRNA-(uracil-5-)-methyltransferase